MMTINRQIDEALKEGGLNQYNQMDVAKSYLLCLLFGLDTGIIPDDIIRRVNLTGICERDYVNDVVMWHIPFLDIDVKAAPIDKNWKWVEDFRQKFRELRPDAAGSSASVMSKMRKFFAEHPEVRVDEVMKATDSYLEDFKQGRSNPKYLQRADYFISKTEADKTRISRLEQYIEIIKKSDEGGQGQLSRVVS